MAQLDSQNDEFLKVIWAENNKKYFWPPDNSIIKNELLEVDHRYINSFYNSILITSSLDVISQQTQKNKYIVFIGKISNISDLKTIQEKTERVFIYDEASFKKKFSLQLEALQSQYTEEKSSENYYKQLFLQNKDLEELTGNLEEIILKRTHDIQISTNEEKNKSSHIKGVINFLNDLPNFYSVEELFNRVRIEFKKFHKIGDLFLIFKNSSEESVLYSTRSGNVTSQIISDHDFTQLENDSLHRDKNLTEIIKRPMMKTISFSIRFDLMNSIQMNKKNGFLFIENGLNDAELYSLQEYFKEIIESFNSHLEKILIEDHLSIFTYRWEKTFDAISNPIVIMDSDFNILRSNKKFSLLYEAEKIDLHVKDAQLQIGHHLYEVYTFPIQFYDSQTAMTFVNYYVDITVSHELKIKNAMSEKMAAIGDLAGNIAHELNNPLSGLRSLAQVIIKETPVTSQIHSDLLEVEKAAGRSQNIIKNLLDFSSGDNQKSSIFNFDEVITSTLPFCKTAMRYLKSQVLLNAKDIKVMGNPYLLQQVVFNLINNASQAMGKEGTLIIKSFQEMIESRSYVVLMVKDTGPGISKENLKKIFEAFYTTKSAGQGAGLGLSISKSIIEKMQGTLDCQSEQGNGAEFKIVLPVYIAGDKI